MPIRRPKARIRTLMAVVAVVALLIVGGRWALEMRRRSERYSKIAASYGRDEAFYLNLAKQNEATILSLKESAVKMRPLYEKRLRARDLWRKLAGMPPGDAGIPTYLKRVDDMKKYIDFSDIKRMTRKERDWAAYNADIRRRYERAARYPWLGEPDIPPEPK